jgi:hypothetical protein
MKDIMVEQAVAKQMDYRQTGLLQTFYLIQYYFFGGACRGVSLC